MLDSICFVDRRIDAADQSPILARKRNQMATGIDDGDVVRNPECVGSVSAAAIMRLASTSVKLSIVLGITTFPSRLQVVCSSKPFEE